MKKVLITDAVHPSIINAIKKWAYEIDYHPKMAYEKLGPIIHEYDDCYSTLHSKRNIHGC